MCVLFLSLSTSVSVQCSEITYGANLAGDEDSEGLQNPSAPFTLNVVFPIFSSERDFPLAVAEVAVVLPVPRIHDFFL